MLLIGYKAPEKKQVAPEEKDPARSARVFMPPPEVLRRMIPVQPRPTRPAPPRAASPALPMPLPTPEPPPPDAAKKDRMSVGAQSSNKPLILKKDEEISVAKGQPNVAPPEPAAPAPAAPQQSADGKGAPEVPGREGLNLPTGLGRDQPRGQEGQKGRPGLVGPALDASIDNQVRKELQRNSQLGLPTG